MAKEWQPDFNCVYRGPWPHPPEAGVGIKLSGVPADASQFLACLAEYGCDELAAREALQVIEAGGEPQLTLESAVSFNAVWEALLDLDVYMKIVAPAARVVLSPVPTVSDSLAFDGVALSTVEVLAQVDAETPAEMPGFGQALGANQ